MSSGVDFFRSDRPSLLDSERRAVSLVFGAEEVADRAGLVDLPWLLLLSLLFGLSGNFEVGGGGGLGKVLVSIICTPYS